MNTKLYKLKHIPTGLYFTPSKGYGNLSAAGKIYINRIPDLKWVKTIRVRFYPETKSMKNKLLSEHFKCDMTKYCVDEYFSTKPEDWEIIEFNEK